MSKSLFNLLIDAVGSLKSNRKCLKKLTMAGGKVAEFFPPLFGFRLFNFKVNYRNHRKIVVIDNKIGYTGGVNIADEYINEVVKFGHWKDTGLRLEGEAVWELTKLFLVDFGINVKKQGEFRTDLYPKQENTKAKGLFAV